MGESFCRKYDQMHEYVETIPMFEKRKLTKMNNDPSHNEHHFLLQHGITLGEYNLFSFLIYSNKRKEYQQKSTLRRHEQIHT